METADYGNILDWLTTIVNQSSAGSSKTEYKLIVPQKELKQLITDEIKTFNQEVADKSGELSGEKG